jgi:hypothetical protein
MMRREKRRKGRRGTSRTSKAIDEQTYDQTRAKR